MRYLLDTCAISELSKQPPNKYVIDFLLSLPIADTFLSSITVGEIRRGIARLPHGKRRLHLETFLERQLKSFDTNILPFDVEAGLIWGDMYASCQQKGINLGSADSLIAAIAIQHSLHIATRNVKHFEPTGALIVNPWARDG